MIKFMDLDKPRGTNTLLIDSLNLAFRYKYINKKSWAVDYISTVKSLAKSYSANKVFVLCDKGSTFRRTIYPEYKKNRRDAVAQQSEEDKANWEAFFEEYNKMLDMIKTTYPVIQLEGVEADDIAALIVSKFKKELAHIWLISSDKDWDLLINENVSRFSFINRKEVTIHNWSEHYIYDIEQHIDVKVLQGDKGDNIPGVEGIGEKRAYALIRKYGSAFDIYDSIPLEGSQQFIKNLNAFKENILRNYKLMDLLTYWPEAMLSEENINKVSQIVEEVINGTES